MPPPTNAPNHATQPLIDALVSRLTRVRPARGWPLATAGWLCVGALVVATALLVSGPLRPGLQASLSTPRLGLELALGALAAFVLAGVGLERDVPGSPRVLRSAGPILALVGLAFWVGLLAAPVSELEAIGLTSPGSAATGKRPHCFVEGLAFAVPPLGLGMLALRRRAVAPGAVSGALLGLAAGVLIASGMQLACQWDPAHALRFHAGLLGPIALASGVLVRFGLPRD